MYFFFLGILHTSLLINKLNFQTTRKTKMQEDGDKKQNYMSDVNSGKRFTFEFEQFLWDKSTVNYTFSDGAQKKIEDERKNIENDLTILNALEQERSRQINIMASLIQLKEELELMLNQT